MGTIEYNIDLNDMENDNHLRLRKVCQDDLELLYEWANDPEVRAASFNTDEISHQNHVSWFERMVNDPAEEMYILMDNEKAVGQIRFSIIGDTAEVSYSISKEVRGNGYGKEIIRLGIKKVEEENPKVNKIVARVNPENVASYWCFEKNGFKERYRQLELDIHKDSMAYEHRSFCEGG